MFQKHDQTLLRTVSLGHLDARDHTLTHTVSLDLGHPDVRGHAPDLEESPLYLGIFEGFHLLVGEEVQALLDEGQGQIQDLEGQGQEEEVLQEADGHIPDLIQNQICDQEMAGEVVQDRREGHALGQGHVYKIGDPDLYQGQGEKDLDQDLARTQEEGVGDQDQETEIEARVKPDLDQSQNQ